MADLVYVNWYATVCARTISPVKSRVAPLALRYGATQYQVHVNNDDRYKITQMTWVPRQDGVVPLLGRAGDDRVPGAQHRQVPGPDRLRVGR